MIKFFKYWFKNFFRKPVRIVFTLGFIMLVLINLQYIGDFFIWIAEFWFWFAFASIGAIGAIGGYNIYKNSKSKGWELTEEEKEEWDEFYKNKQKK